MISGSRLSHHASLLCLLVAYVGLSVGYLTYTTDDTFITLRYARNLIDGQGLVFNPGERVEGYSNFLFMIVVAALGAVGMDLLLAAKLVGMAFGAATIVLVMRVGQEGRTGGGGAGWVAPVLLVSWVPFAVWGAAGLETLLYGFLITATARLIARRHIAGGGGFGAGILLGLLSLTRAEGVFFALALLGALTLWDAYRHRSWGWRIWAGMAAVFVPFEVWRLWYYGLPLPNTVYAKVNPLTLRSVSETLRFYLVGCVGVIGGPFLFVVVSQLLWAHRRTDRRVVVYSMAVAVQVAFVLLVGGDWMPGWRFLVPIFPLVALLVQEGLTLAYRRYMGGGMSRGWAVGAVGAMVCADIVLGHTAVKKQFGGIPSWYREPTYERIVSSVAANGTYLEMSRWIADNLPDRDSAVLALGEAGFIPYTTGMRALDLYGLTNPEILQENIPRERMGVLHRFRITPQSRGPFYPYLSRVRPDYLLLTPLAFDGASPPDTLWGGLYRTIHAIGGFHLYQLDDRRKVEHP